MIWLATTAADLGEISALVHDAHLDEDDITFDAARETCAVAFVQHGEAAPELPQPVLTGRRWWWREYRVPLLRGRLVVHHVTAVSPTPGSVVVDSLLGVSGAGDEIVVSTTPTAFRMSVRALRVEAELTDAIAAYATRRRGPLGESETVRP